MAIEPSDVIHAFLEELTHTHMNIYIYIYIYMSDDTMKYSTSVLSLK